MTSQLQIKRRVNGATGSPAAAGSLEGELAVNFPGAAGTGGLPELWAFDGTAWRRINPAASVSTESVDLRAPGGADIGAAATAWIAANQAFAGDIVIATYGTPAQAYVLTNPAAPGTAGSWTSLGGSTPFATAAEILTGTEAAKAIAPDQLRAHTLNAPTGTPANDANHLVRLDATGRIDAGFLPVTSLKIHSATAPTTDPGTLTVAEGDIIFFNAAGNLHAGWGIAGNPAVNTGDSIIYDGTAWHLVPNELDLSNYLPLDGGTMNDGAAVTFDRTADKAVAAVVAGTQDPMTIIDGDGGVIDDVIINGGTF